MGEILPYIHVPCTDVQMESDLPVLNTKTPNMNVIIDLLIWQVFLLI